MERIKIKDLPADHTVSRQDMKMVLGGTETVRWPDMNMGGLAGNIIGDDAEMLRAAAQQWSENLTRHITMLSNLSSTWDEVMDSIVRNTK